MAGQAAEPQAELLVASWLEHSREHGLLDHYIPAPNPRREANLAQSAKTRIAVLLCHRNIVVCCYLKNQLIRWRLSKTPLVSVC